LNNPSPRLIGNLEKGIVFVISAPSGTGKTTLTQMICQEFPGKIFESVSCTTRPKRAHEQDGVHYHFISEEEFKQKILEDAFVEYVQVFDHYYGTLKSELTKKTASGAHVILVIDTQGAMRIKKLIDATFIFIAPPSLEELERRLKLRQTEDDEMIKKRLEWADKEMTYAEQYDYFIINEDLQLAYQVFKSIVISEEHRNRLR
jgi:guanylate kinase